MQNSSYQSSQAPSEIDSQELSQINNIPVDISYQYNSNMNTQVSFLNDAKQVKKLLSGQFSDNIKELVQNLRSQRSLFVKPFIEYLNKNKKDIKIQILKNQSFDLDFIPTFVLLDTRHTSLQQLQKILKEENFGAKIAINIDEKKIIHKNYITFQPNMQMPFYFKIKELPMHYDKSKEADVLIDKFFEFHLNIIQGFKTFSAYIFHWADARKILHEQFLPAGALKIMLVVFLYVHNIPNLIQEYMKKYQDQLNKMDDYIEIGPKGTQIAKKEQINKFPNSLLEERKGFYLKSENAYDESFQIRKIPFPIIQVEINQMKQKLGENSSKIFKTRSVGQWVSIFFKFSQTVLNINSTLTIDLTSKNKKFWNKQESTNPTLNVIHPVFKYNITQHLSRKINKKDSKDSQHFKNICQEFGKAYALIQTGEMSDLIALTDEYMD